jgi:hypothetical protein
MSDLLLAALATVGAVTTAALVGLATGYAAVVGYDVAN